jgi:aryl-alcohol dehydrogenase-like predicted oxidoreductase
MEREVGSNGGSLESRFGTESASTETISRSVLPRADDRIRLGQSGKTVSPVCLGRVSSEETVLRAYEAGINFFFLSADLHWPVYQQLRRGLSRLLAGNSARRDEIVVAAASYVDEPLFGYLQLNEILDAVPGLKRIDVLVAGAVSNGPSFKRIETLEQARRTKRFDSVAVGATFHERRYALTAARFNVLDIAYIRYNTGHPNARKDLFPYLPAERKFPVFNFNSMLSCVGQKTLNAMGLSKELWRPDPVDYYRFVLSNPNIDGLLCSPQNTDELRQVCSALHQSPLTASEQDYMITLSARARYHAKGSAAGV